MLGFSTFTETPFAEADANNTVFADCNSTLVQTGVGSVTVTAEASSALPSLVSTTTATNNLVIEADSKINMPSVSASADVNSLTANIEVTISSQVSTLSISSLTHDAQANASISSIVGSFVNTNIDIQAKAAITIDSTVAVILTEDDFTSDGQTKDITVSGKANTNTSSLLLTAASLDVIPTVHAEILVGSVASETQVAPLADIDAQANASLASIFLSSGLTDFADEDAEATVVLTSLRGSLTTVLSSPTAVMFPYQDFANDYSRQRTLFLVSADTNNTVHIPADPANRTVFVQSTASNAGNRTVKIAA
tara:strand:- start:1555 stop:2481 length:927 start_codon:yes stop_codon:yes gene_type:complete